MNVASRVQASADGGEMLLTEEVFKSDGVAALVESSGWEVVPAQVPLRGINEATTVYRVSAGASGRESGGGVAAVAATKSEP